MKRAILKTVKVAPYTSGDAIDREGFLSGVIGVKVGTPTGSPTALAVKAVFTHSDASDGTFTACGDKLIVLDSRSPHRERGLKYRESLPSPSFFPSLPTRGAWIEI